jgi:hypothetical protein
MARWMVVLLVMGSFLAACGEQKTASPDPASSAEFRKEIVDQVGNAKVARVSTVTRFPESAPFKLFTVSKEKITEDDLKILRKVFLFSGTQASTEIIVLFGLPYS